MHDDVRTGMATQAPNASPPTPPKPAPRESRKRCSHVFPLRNPTNLSAATPPTLARSGTTKFWLPLYLIFAAAVCWACYHQPIPQEFDRWMYDAVVRTNLGESVQQVFSIVKHSSPRIEQSSAVASPEHLGIIEPMFAIKVVYVEILTLMVKAGLSVERAISLVSIAAIFALALIIALWTRSPILSALLVISPAALALGRSGTPDALSTAVVLGGLWAITSNRLTVGLLLLLVSIWIRTDNVLLTLVVILWLLLSARLPLYQATVAALLAVASVLAINHFSGNYGWLVLFRCSFLGCKPPLDNLPRIDRARISGSVRNQSEDSGAASRPVAATRPGSMAHQQGVAPAPGADSRCHHRTLWVVPVAGRTYPDMGVPGRRNRIRIVPEEEPPAMRIESWSDTPPKVKAAVCVAAGLLSLFWVRNSSFLFSKRNLPDRHDRDAGRARQPVALRNHLFPAPDGIFLLGRHGTSLGRCRFHRTVVHSRRRGGLWLCHVDA